MNEIYIRTVQLLLDVAPTVFDTTAFAMKGGTAINLFVQDMPRLSVDIDVVFIPHALKRIDALKTIADELASAQSKLQKMGYEAALRKSQDGTEAKMFVRSQQAEVKVEVNFVFRGTVLPPQRRSLTPAAQNLFAANIQVPVLDNAELYGSKLVAALDRQHPRDLFDVQLMLARHGWEEPLLDCFVVYLAGHNRPTHEVLFPKEKQLEAIFAAEFDGMTRTPVSLASLLETRRQMLAELPRALLPRQRDFLMSMVQAEPDWSLLPYAHAAQLPALQWKLQNLIRLKKNVSKFNLQRRELAGRFAQM
ncbi:MAG: nucleotidyl transferase AbiEii/AbiGii toxin family protein [Burkholderiaceae bacterium]